MKYRHKFISTDPTSETPQLPNVFHETGRRVLDDIKFVGLVQECQQDPAPTWWAIQTFEQNFEPIP